MFDYITTSNAKNPKVTVNVQKRKLCSHPTITIPDKFEEFKKLKIMATKRPQ